MTDDRERRERERRENAAHFGQTWRRPLSTRRPTRYDEDRAEREAEERREEFGSADAVRRWRRDPE